MGYVKQSIIACFFLLLSSCGINSGTPEANDQLTVRETSERLISNDIANAIGQGELSPVCPEVPNPQQGITFECSAVTADNKQVFVNGKVESDGRVSLTTSNVLISSDIPRLEEAAVAYVNNQLGKNYPDNTMNCGEESVVLNVDKVIACSFIEPGSGDIYDSEVRIEDIETNTVVVRIEERPRA